MKRIVGRVFLAVMAIMMAMQGAMAQVDLQQSFGVMRKDNKNVMLPEGGNWKITFSNRDSLDNEYHKPVQMLFNGALTPDTTGIFIEDIDSLMFDVPEMQYAPGMFEIDKYLFNYIVESDSVKTIYFRIDCLTKLPVPKVGQKVICNIYRGKLPYGFAGRVESMTADYMKGWVEMKCTPLKLEEIYDVLYTCGVSGVEDEDEVVPQSVIEQRAVKKRIKTRSGDMNIETGDVELIKKEFKGQLTIDKNFKVKVEDITDKDEDEDGGEDEDTPPITVVAEGEIVLSANCSVIIDNSISLKQIKCEVDFSASGKITLDAKVELSPGKDDKTELEFLSIPIPVVVIPGLSINLDLAFTWDYLFEASLHAEASIKVQRTAGFIIDGINADVIWTTKEENNSDGKKSFEAGASGELVLKGEVFVGLLFKVGLGLAGEGLEMQLELGTGPKLEAQLTYKFGQIARSLSDDPEWLKERIEIFQGLNEGTYFKLKWGFIVDFSLSVWDGTFQIKASDWLKLIGKENKVFVDLWGLSAAPDTKSINDRYLEEYLYKGQLKNGLRLIFPYDVGLMLIDESPGALRDGSPDLVLEGLDKFNAISKNDANFRVTLHDQPHLWGRNIVIYPFAFNSFFTGYGIMGKMDSIYIEYKVAMKESDMQYDNCSLRAEFSQEALDNPYITEGGFIFTEAGSDKEFYRIKKFENFSPGSNVMEEMIFRKDFTAEKFKVKAYLYDAANKHYTYSKSWDAGFNSYYDPVTLEPVEVTAVGATLKGRVHQSVLDEENMDHMSSKFNVGFVCNPGNDTETYPLGSLGLCDFSRDMSGRLEPDKEYKFYAVNIDNETNRQYKGKELTFKTKPVFHDFKVEASIDNVGLLVMVDRGYVGVTNRSKYKFVVSEDKDTWEDDGFVVKDSEMKDRSEYLDEMVIVRVIDAKYDDFARDDVKDDYDLVVLTEKGWVPGRTYYAKVVYDDGVRPRVETDVLEFKIPDPIGNMVENPGSDEAEMFANVLFPYAKGRAVITVEYASEKNDLFDEEVNVLRVDNIASWIDDGVHVCGMRYILPELNHSTTYYYRYRVEKTVDGVTTEFVSEINEFKTKKKEYIVTLDPPLVDKNRAVLRGRVNELLWKLLDESVPVGDDFIRNYMVRFDISRDKDMKEPTGIYDKFDDGREWELELPDLDWDSDFYCQLVVQTADGAKTYKSAIKKFTIGPEPAENFSVTTFDAVLDDEWTTLKGKVNSTILEAMNDNVYGEMIFGFEYAPTESDLLNGTSAVIRDTDVALNKSTGLFTRVLQLKPNTTHHCRAFVYFAGKFVYGNIVDFTTADYDAGLIIPDLEAAKARALKAIMLEDGNVDKVIFIEDGKVVVPSMERVQRMLKME